MTCLTISTQTETEEWGTEEVCQWLDLVGLGSFKRAFKERSVNGYMLLHMDVKLFGKAGLNQHSLNVLIVPLVRV